MSAETKEILHESVYREKPLGVCGGFEAAHLSLALPRRLMRHLRSIVLILPGAVNHGRHDRAVGRRIAAQLVRDQTVGRPTLSFQYLSKEAHGCSAIAARLDQDVEEVAVLVHCPVWSPTFSRGTPTVVIDRDYLLSGGSGRGYDIDPSGERFLLLKPSGEPGAGSLRSSPLSR